MDRARIATPWSASQAAGQSGDKSPHSHIRGLLGSPGVA